MSHGFEKGQPYSYLGLDWDFKSKLWYLSYTDKDGKPWFETTGMSGMHLSHDRFCEMFIKLEDHPKVKVIKGHLKSIDLEVS